MTPNHLVVSQDHETLPAARRDPQAGTRQKGESFTVQGESFTVDLGGAHTFAVETEARASARSPRAVPWLRGGPIPPPGRDPRRRGPTALKRNAAPDRAQG